MLRALGEPPALPLRAARLRGVGAVEAVRADRLRDVHVDSAERVDQILEIREVDDDDVIHVEARERMDRPDRQRRAAVLEGGVDLLGPEAWDRHLDVARNRQVVQPVMRRVGAQQQNRVGVTVAGASADLRVVGAEHQDRGGVRDQKAALGCERQLRVLVESLVRIRDATGEGEPARDAPDDDQDDEDRDGDRDAAPPAWAARAGARSAGPAVLRAAYARA